MKSTMRKPWMPWVLMVVAVGLLAATAMAAVSAFGVQMRTTAALKPVKTAKPAETKDGKKEGEQANPPDTNKQVELSEAFNKLLDEKAFFGKQTRNPQLQSVIGEYAIIDGQWIKQGEEQNGVKVLEINRDKVKIEFEGNTRELNLFQDMPGVPQPQMTPPPGPPPSAEGEVTAQTIPQAGDAGPAAAATGTEPASGAEMQGQGMQPITLTPGNLGHFQGLPPGARVIETKSADGTTVFTIESE